MPVRPVGLDAVKETSVAGGDGTRQLPQPVVRSTATVTAVCGRFVSTSPPDEIAKYFGPRRGRAPVGPDGAEPNYNVAPTTDVYVVLEDGGVRQVEALHWGLVPFWAKEAKVGNRR